MNKFLLKNLLLRPAYFFRGEEVFKLQQMYLELEKGGADAIHAYKQQKIVDICRFAAEKIPYFKRLGLAGDRLGAFPVLSKDMLRDSLSDFLLPDVRYSWRSTSGSTGVPFVFPKDRLASAHMDALMHHFYSWHGVETGDRQARLWGTKLKLKGKTLQYMQDLLLNRRRLSAFKMRDPVCKSYYENLLRFRPRFFYAYSNALYQFALSLERQNLDGKQLRIKVAICTGEVLFPFQREKIEQVFCCRVVNEYGSTENGIIAFECEHHKLHLAPTLEVEIIDPDCDGFGRVVITELNSRAIPFVRYDIGDIARLVGGHCDCGRTLQVIEIREGRSDDYVRCPDGGMVYDAIFAYALKDSVVKFKAVQVALDEIQISVVPKSGCTLANEHQILSALREHLGEEIRIKFAIVQDIPPEKSGKLRYFVSRLP